MVWGNTADPKRIRQGIGQPFVEYLPFPPIVFPELIDISKDLDENLESCAEALENERQGLNINAMMGLLLVEMLRQFLTGRLAIHFAVLDLVS